MRQTGTRATLRIFVCLTCISLIGVLWACASNGGDAGSGDPELLIEIPTAGGPEDCICGTPRGDFHGCHCSECFLNGGNPFNPDCTCLPLRPSSELDSTYASTGTNEGMATTLGGNLVGLDEIKLKGLTKKLKGQVIEDTGESIRFEAEDGVVSTYTYEQLDYRVVYKLLKAKTSREDGEAEMRLASYAAEVGLYAHARRHFGYALEADSSLEQEIEAKLAGMRAKAAKAEMDKADAAMATGDNPEAREHLLNVLREFPDEAAAQVAAVKINAMAVERLGPEAAGKYQNVAPESLVLLEPVGKLYDSAVEKNRQGLTASSQAKARGDYRAALSDAEKARRELDSAAKRGSGADFPDLVQAADAKIIALLVEVYLSLASAEIVEGDYDSALKNVNAALALDPQNELALQQRTRIEAERRSYDEGYRQGYQSGSSNSNIDGSYYYGYRRGIGYRRQRRLGLVGRYGGWSVSRMTGGVRLGR